MKKIFALTFALAFSFSVGAQARTRQKVIPIGQVVGICMTTDGLLVTETVQLTDENGNEINAAENAGIKKGDRVISADGIAVDSCESLTEYVQTKKNDMVLTVKRNETVLNKTITPVKTSDGFRLGMWLRDSTAGLGTITYVNPETGGFGALGHGITDIDTSTLMICKEGKLCECVQNKPTPGERGIPGELNGEFTDKALGTISKNTPVGIFGVTDKPQAFSSEDITETAYSEEVSEGEAVILANVEGEGVFEYPIEIKRISRENSEGKNMVFEVKSVDLISKTGGIVPGMSGSPIMQNGRLVGAVTHVFVNNPKKGYGIFIDNMIAEAEDID